MPSTGFSHRCLAMALLLAPAPALSAPKVAADIPAVHSIVSAVMEGVGAPRLVMAPGASPHHYAMRPSEAEALAEADLVFWIGPELTPWLERALTALRPAASAPLMHAEGVRLHDFREGAAFEAHDHGEDEHGDHGDEGRDPHVWLAPDNARAMARAAAAALAAADPENAERYRGNARAFAEELKQTERAIAARLSAANGRPFIVFHDAYRYFEEAFEVRAAGAIALSDAATPGPARIAAVQDLILAQDVACIFIEPQFDPRLAERLSEGIDVKLGVLDPHGASLALGPDLYPALLTALAESLATCFEA